VVLGSTGSIGVSTLDVLAALPERFSVLALAANSNQQRLREQVQRFRPRFASLSASSVPLDGVEVVDGTDSLVTLATLPEADIVVVATTGHAAIQATIAALEAGKIVALANKEAVVAAGEIVMPIARRGPGELRPIDSEHVAIWQCLHASRADPDQVRRIILTASGGPFRGWSRERLKTVKPADALKHPTWAMGAKITIDSATLMNKGFEIIEAAWLFDFPPERIDVVVHQQSLVHSLVEFEDGAFLAQIGSHDMRVPIQYALTYPDRVAGPGNRLSLADLSRLDFEPPDEETFPLMRVARQALQQGQTYPAVLSAADTLAVQLFLEERIGFLDIERLIRAALDAHVPEGDPVLLTQVSEAQQWTRRFVSQEVN
jgi:1-deoxy-D-xylulose-5-phosphate reductoisomerase